VDNIDFNYQRIISDDCVPISSEKVSYFPLLVDYSSTYKYNQYNIVSAEEKLIKKSGFDELYVEDVPNDNVIFTDKETTLGVPLFYQYQPKFDAVNIQNIKLYDSDNKRVPVNVEYGSIDIGSRADYPLNNNEALHADSLDDKTELGINMSGTSYSFLNNVGQDLPYTNHDMCLSNGRVDYSSTLLADEGQFEIYFMAKERTSDVDEPVLSFKGGDVEVNFVYTHSITEYKLDFLVDGVSKGTLAVTQGVWYKLYVTWAKDGVSSEIKVTLLSESGTASQNINTLAESFIDSLTGQDFYIRANNSYLYNMAIFDHVVEDTWINPIYLYRYSKSIIWHTASLTSPYRIRLLLPDDQEYTLIYDAVDEDGGIILNKKEIVNCELLYKKYSAIEVNDWYYADGTVTLTETLYDNCFPGWADTDTLWMAPIVEKQIKVYLDNQNKINVINGIFKGDDFDDTGDYFYLPEYDEIPLMVDNQVSEPIFCWKIIREKAKIIGDYKFKINKFLCNEGMYPDYVIPGTYEEHKYARFTPAPSGVVDLIVDTNINYISIRGLNIYINNELIDNSEIINYHYSGIIELSRRLKSDDNVRVTYLRKADSYIAQYPNVSKDVIAGNEFQLYLRPSYSNYSVLHPLDPIERMVYKVMTNGIPGDTYYSCLTGEEINVSLGTDHDYIKLADITMISTAVYTDIRRTGGGIKEDDDLGSIDIRNKKFPLSRGYMDIGYVNGEQIPNSIIFYKIPRALKAELDTKFDTPEKCMMYIKKEIEKHIAAGVYFLIVDENDILYDEPFSEVVKDIIGK